MRAFLTAAVTPCLLVGALACSAAGLSAQFPLPGANPAAANPPGAAPAGERNRPADGKVNAAEAKSMRTVAIEHGEEKSRALFAACDADADDRLDLFEARIALRAPAAPEQIGWFRRLDHDRDGFVDWPEFDRHFRDVVQNGGVLHLQFARPLADSTETASSGASSPAPKATPSKPSFDTFDKNRDKKLDAAEVLAMLQALGAPPSAAAMLPLLDKNKDNALSEAELAPALQQFAPSLLGGPVPAPAAVPAGAFADLDADGNGAVTAHELGRALRRIDPQLERWAPALVQRLDRNGDQLLRATELPTAPAPRPQAMVEPKPKR